MRHRGSRRTSTRSFILTTLTACAAVLFLLTAAAPAGAYVGLGPDWSGYGVARPGVRFDQVSASWRVPTATCSAGGVRYSLVWVGLGDETGLQQIGTETDCGSSGSAAGSVAYATPFWEILPLPEQHTSFVLMPGDLVHASVTIAGHQITMELVDRTRRWTFVKRAHRANVDESSAEWMVEDPLHCPGLTVPIDELCPERPFANFSKTTISEAQARTTTGRSGSISSPLWTATERELVAGRPPFVAAAPTPLSAGGTAFSVSRTHRPLPPEPV